MINAVLIAYVDESYDRDYYFLGAAIASYEAWDALASRYDAVRAATAERHHIPADAEFHGHEIMGGTGDWSAFRGKHREAVGVYVAALRAARDCGVRYLFRGLDISRLHARYAYPHQPHDIVFSHLLERIDEYTAKTHQTEQTIVVADQIATQEDHKAQFIGYQQDGTAGYRPSKLERISAPINFADSRQTPGLQAADLAVYIHRRRSTMREKHPQARRSMARIINLIDPTTEHSWTWKP